MTRNEALGRRLGIPVSATAFRHFTALDEPCRQYLLGGMDDLLRMVLHLIEHTAALGANPECLHPGIVQFILERKRLQIMIDPGEIRVNLFENGDSILSEFAANYYGTLQFRTWLDRHLPIKE